MLKSIMSTFAMLAIPCRNFFSFVSKSPSKIPQFVDGEGGSNERWFKWGGVGWGIIKGSFQKHLKIGGG